jgi:branched-chain amino acid transport system substrate-binding protein
MIFNVSGDQVLSPVIPEITMTSGTRRLCLSIVACLAFLLLPFAGRAADPYDIYVIQSLTGAGQFIGNAQTAGFKALEAYVNSTNGIRGRPVHFVISDDQSSPQVAVQITNELLAKHPAIIMGASNTAACRAMFPLAKSGPVIYCLSPAVKPAPNSFEFSIDPDTPDMTSVGTRYFRLHGWTRIAELSTTDATGQNFDQAIDGVLALPENKDVRLVAREHFNPADISAQAQLARIRAANPQVIILGTSGTPTGTAMRGISDLQINVPIATSNAAATYAMMSQYAPILPKDLYFFAVLNLAPEAITNKAVQSEIGIYSHWLSRAGVKPDGIPSNTWDAGSIVVSAFRKLGTAATADQIRDYIANLRGFPGAMGVYDFKTHPGRGVGEENVVIVRWDATRGTWVGVSRPGGIPLKGR